MYLTWFCHKRCTDIENEPKLQKKIKLFIRNENKIIGSLLMSSNQYCVFIRFNQIHMVIDELM